MQHMVIGILYMMGCGLCIASAPSEQDVKVSQKLSHFKAAIDLQDKSAMKRLLAAGGLNISKEPSILVYVVEACDMLTQQKKQAISEEKLLAIEICRKQLAEIVALILPMQPDKTGIKRRCDMSHLSSPPCTICPPVYQYVYGDPRVLGEFRKINASSFEDYDKEAEKIIAPFQKFRIDSQNPIPEKPSHPHSKKRKKRMFPVSVPGKAFDKE